MFKSILSTLFVFIFLLHLHTVQAQTPAVIDAKIETSFALRVGVTTDMHKIAHRPLELIDEKERKRRNKPVPNFPGRTDNNQIKYPGAPYGEDPVRQHNVSRDKRFVSTPKVNVEGIDRAFAGPRVPDTDGDIGKDYFVQCVNSSYYQVFDKNGNTIGNPVDFNNLWAPLGFTSFGDPIILFDQEYNRWIITEFAPTGSNQLLIAISNTSDPLGTFTVYNFATPNFPDYPKYSIWKNTVYISTNESGSSVHHLYFLDKDALMTGAATVRLQRIEIPGVNNSPGFMVATPLDWSGQIEPATDALPTAMYIQDDAWGAVAQDQLEIFSFDIDFDDSDSTVVTQTSIPTSPFDSDMCAAPGGGFACVPQPNSSGMDGLPYVIMNQMHYRNFITHESIVLNFSVDYTGTSDPISGIRWMELRRPDPSVAWSVFQEGTYAPDDGLHRFMGAIAMDGLGNIGLGFNVASDTEFAGLRYTGRRVNDALGVMTVDEYNLATGQGITQDDRFGDYATMAVDPVDDRTFWFTGEYMKSNSQWGTKVVAFNLFRDSIDIGPIDVVRPASAPALTNMETAEIIIKNFGLDTIFSFNMGYILDGNSPVMESISRTLLPDSSVSFIFTVPMDLSQIGNHSLEFITELTDDTNPSNDRLKSAVNNIPFIDAAITGFGDFSNFICGNKAELTIQLTNYGIDTLTSARIDIFLNNTLLDTLQWNGQLAMGQTDLLSYQLANLTAGLSEYTVTSNLPNGQLDEVPINDTSQISVTSAPNNSTSRLELIPDRFPQEITWQLTNENGVILYSGGPYTGADDLVVAEWCLAPACHTFTIFDASSDGICCGFGDGSYQILDPSGNVLISSTGEYGAQEESTFCLDSCVVQADIEVTQASAADSSDGAILLMARNGKTPYKFSIDGGANFQFSNMFNDLPVGFYPVQVKDRDNCIYRDTIEITSCFMNVITSTSDESAVNAEDGSISIHVDGGIPPYVFSVDGGIIYQSDTLFSSLSAGNYDVVVLDSSGCAFTQSVFVDLNVATTTIFHGKDLRIYPNPTDGLFSIELDGIIGNELYLPFRIHNSQGKLILDSKLVRYNETYKGAITIERLPAGAYYLIFPGNQINGMTRIIKN